MATSRNVFDQFDAPAPGNVFDQFDAPKAEKSGLIANYFGGMLEPAAKMGSSMLAGPVSGLAGLGALGLNAMGAKTDPADVVEKVGGAMTYQPRTDAGRATSALVEYPFQKLQQAADRAGDPIATGGDPNRPLQMRIPGRGPVSAKEYGDTGSPGMATAINAAIQAAPALLLRGRGKPAELAADVPRTPSMGPPVAAGEAAAAAPVQAGRNAGLGQVRAAPSKAELSKAADAAYKVADESGVVVTPESFGTLKSKIVSQMERDGIDPTLHPDATAALKRITESDGSLSLQKLETLRRVANDAQGSIKPADRRLAGKMVDEIDDYIESLTEKDVVAGDATKAGALKQARNLYSRKKKADEIDQLVHRAELTASNFTGSGMENALRTEFRALAKNEKRMRRFTAEEREAIEHVAKGGKMENALRMLGKFAPTGIVSTALGMGSGFFAGGPFGSVALPAAGAAARHVATRMTLRNVERANELMRRGPLGSPGGKPVQIPQELQRVR